MFTVLMYIVALGFLILSFIKDKKKTLKALKKAWKSFENILPQFLSILVIIGIMLAVLSPEVISGLIGEKSGGWGMLMASLVGSITLIPGFIAFPLACQRDINRIFHRFGCSGAVICRFPHSRSSATKGKQVI